VCAPTRYRQERWLSWRSPFSDAVHRMRASQHIPRHMPARWRRVQIGANLRARRQTTRRICRKHGAGEQLARPETSHRLTNVWDDAAQRTLEPLNP